MKNSNQRKSKSNKVIVTRALSQARPLLQRLIALGFETFHLPTIEIQPPDDEGKELRESIQNLAKYDWIILTSSNGVEMFLREINDRTVLDQKQIAVIGSGTEKTLKQYGFEADLIPHDFSAEGLVQVFPAFQDKGRVLLPSATQARDFLPTALQKFGWTVDVVHAYQTCIPKHFDPFNNQKIGADIIIFTSPSTIENFISMYGLENMPPKIISIGPVTSNAIRNFNLGVDLEANPSNTQGIIDCLLNQ
ncbi:MAG TPA: uroporphyrinogen-III synthase [Acidimicrobiales bacterium]|jgi:uroporphyrinogen III methyltransferase/synthase|nr:uroporphyrinogen-III synthase [Acidimicrobiales bacterium]|tara:strand:- start:4336 stop:5082 length:747 start_codon:yes stop_codon:yes gene_type:complete